MPEPLLCLPGSSSHPQAGTARRTRHGRPRAVALSPPNTTLVYPPLIGTSRKFATVCLPAKHNLSQRLPICYTTSRRRGATKRDRARTADRFLRGMGANRCVGELPSATGLLDGSGSLQSLTTSYLDQRAIRSTIASACSEEFAVVLNMTPSGRRCPMRSSSSWAPTLK